MRSGSDQPPRGRFVETRPFRQQPQGQQRNQTLNSHGPAERIGGNASQIYQRYLTLAREAARGDDRVAAENYYQHAEHYLRLDEEGREGSSATELPLTDHAQQALGVRSGNYPVYKAR
jgi:hypothetical protein